MLFFESLLDSCLIMFQGSDDISMVIKNNYITFIATMKLSSTQCNELSPIWLPNMLLPPSSSPIVLWLIPVLCLASSLVLAMESVCLKVWTGVFYTD